MNNLIGKKEKNKKLKLNVGEEYNTQKYGFYSVI